MLTFFTTLSAALDTLRRHALLFLFLLAAAALALLGRDWLAQRDARAKLEATLAAQQKIVTDADQRESARDAQLAQTLSQITALKKSVQTPTQAAAALSKAVPQLATTTNGQALPSPIQLTIPTASAPGSTNPTNSPNSTSAANSSDASTAPSNSTNAASNSSNLKSQISNPSSSSPPPTASTIALNNLKSQLATLQSSSTAQQPQQGTGATQQGTTPPPAIVTIPQSDLKPLFNMVEDCQTCQAQLASAQGDLADERTKSAAITAQRDAALKSAHGTFWSRARTAAKWFIIGAAAGAVIAKYH